MEFDDQKSITTEWRKKYHESDRLGKFLHRFFSSPDGKHMLDILYMFCVEKPRQLRLPSVYSTYAYKDITPEISSEKAIYQMAQQDLYYHLKSIAENYDINLKEFGGGSISD